MSRSKRKSDISTSSKKSKSIRIPPPDGSGVSLEFRSVTQSVDEAVVISDARGNIIFWNEGAVTIFGYSEKEIIGKPLALLIPVQSDNRRGAKLQQKLFNNASPMDWKTHELKGIHENGNHFPVELSVLTWKLGNSTFFTTIIRDITERKRLQKEILEISALEQQRIGQDLHDDLCQQFTAVTLLSEVLENKLAGKSLSEAVDAREIHDLVAKAIVQTRLLAKGLLPVDLEVHGLAAALEGLAANTEKLAHIRCRADVKEPVSVRDGAVAIHLYRIAQEAVTNAVKHSRAKNVTIALSDGDGMIHLAVIDDGVGIAEGSLKNNGLGLSIMNSRAETINAALQIRRGEKGGTIVSCSLRAPARSPRTPARRS